MAAMTQHYLAA